MKYEEIRNKIKWFKSIFGDAIYDDGWQFEYQKPIHHPPIIRIGRIIYPGDQISEMTLDDACEFAKAYGWTLNGNIVVGFDINKLTRNKHLLDCKELGLL